MRIYVKVKPSSRENKVIPPEDSLFNVEGEKKIYKVFVKEPPIEGRANDAVLRLLAEYFHCPRSSVRLVSGSTAMMKVFEVQD